MNISIIIRLTSTYKHEPTTGINPIKLNETKSKTIEIISLWFKRLWMQWTSWMNINWSNIWDNIFSWILALFVKQATKT